MDRGEYCSDRCQPAVPSIASVTLPEQREQDTDRTRLCSPCTPVRPSSFRRVRESAEPLRLPQHGYVLDDQTQPRLGRHEPDRQALYDREAGGERRARDGLEDLRGKTNQG